MKTIIVIPTLNEKDNIGLLIEAIVALNQNYHILIVDDDSPDGTGTIADQYAHRLPVVQVFHRYSERGRGRAGIAGFLRALELGADYIVEMDADFSHDPQYLPALVAALSEYDMVLGSRYVPGGKDDDRGALRRYISKLANGYERVVLGVTIKDCTSGYRAYRRAALEAINLNTIATPGPAVLSDILYRVHSKGFRIGEIPITFIDRKRGSSTLTSKILLATLSNVLRVRWQGIPES